MINNKINIFKLIIINARHKLWGVLLVEGYVKPVLSTILIKVALVDPPGGWQPVH